MTEYAIYTMSFGENLKAFRDRDSPGRVALLSQGTSLITCSSGDKGVGTEVAGRPSTPARSPVRDFYLKGGVISPASGSCEASGALPGPQKNPNESQAHAATATRVTGQSDFPKPRGPGSGAGLLQGPRAHAFRSPPPGEVLPAPRAPQPPP